MKKIALLLSLCLLLATCKENDTPTEVSNRAIFTFTFTDNYPNTETWIVLRDNSSGELIDSRQITVPNTPVVFESTKPITNNKIDVTVFEAKDPNGNSLVQVYPAIDIGAIWMYPGKTGGNYHEIPDYGGYIGYYTLKVNNVPSLFTINVSDKFGELAVYEGTYTYSSGTITAHPIITGNGHSQLVTIDTGSGKPKYTMVDDPVVDKVVNLDYSTFKEYDRYVNFVFPTTKQFSDDVRGYEQGFPINHDSYVMHYYFNSPVERSELNFGVLNSLPNYGIELYVSPGDDSFTYASYGPAPTSIAYVSSSSFEVSSTSIGDYKIINSIPFDYRAASYRYSAHQVTIQFSYYAPQGYPVQHRDALTPELVTKYGIDMSLLVYTGTSFQIGRSYNDFLKYTFDPGQDIHAPYSETSVYKRNE